MRPLFAIAPLALLLAFIGPRPSERDDDESAHLALAASVATPMPYPASSPDHQHGSLGSDRGVQALRASLKGTMVSATADAGYPAALPR